MDDSPDTLLDLESHLLHDPDGSRRAALLARLADLETDLRRRCRTGLPPAEYQGCAAVAAAVAAATAVVHGVSP